nr:MAG TPA: hypothetical protein [Caudoviricetes sp.]
MFVSYQFLIISCKSPCAILPFAILLWQIS